MDYGIDEKSEKNNKGPENKKNLNKKKIIYISAIILIIAVIITLIMLYIKNENVKEFFDKYIFRKEVYENNLPTIELKGIGVSNIYAYDKNIVVLEQNQLKVYNKSGQEEYTLDVNISSPIFDSNGSYLCVADKNEKRVYLISGKNIIWQKSLEGQISNICVNKNGYVSVATSDTIYKTVIETYNNKGEKLFKRYLSTTYVIDMDISSDNQYLAIAEANFSGIVIQSNIKVISIEEARKDSDNSIVYTHIAESNDLAINIEYNNKNNLICMYDSHVDSIKEQENIELINFANEDALFVDINVYSNIIKILKKSTGMFSAEAEMQIINTSTVNSPVIYAIEDVPKKVYTYDNMICINLGTEVLFINSNGWLIRRYKSSQEIQNIVLCDNVAGIIYNNKIELISL